METFQIEIKNKKKVRFIKELLASFDYVTVENKNNSRKKAVDKKKKEFKKAFNDVKLHQQGKNKLKTLDEVLNEL